MKNLSISLAFAVLDSAAVELKNDSKESQESTLFYSNKPTYVNVLPPVLHQGTYECEKIFSQYFRHKNLRCEVQYYRYKYRGGVSSKLLKTMACSQNITSIPPVCRVEKPNLLSEPISTWYLTVSVPTQEMS